MKSSDHQPAWVAILVAIIMAIVGPLIIQDRTNRSIESQKQDTSVLAQEVASISDRVNQINLAVQAVGTASPSGSSPSQGVELADLNKLNTQLDELEQQIAALKARPSPTPLPGPIASQSDLEALNNRVSTLQKMLEERPTAAPMTIPTVLAQEGIPLDYKLPLVGARASSTDGTLDSNEKPRYAPEMAIDSDNETRWLSDPAETEKAWLEIDLEAGHTITGIKFMGHLASSSQCFEDLTLIFSDGTAQDLHLTQAQQAKTGWQYFPLVSTQASRIRIVITKPRYQPGFAEIEVYGR